MKLLMVLFILVAQNFPVPSPQPLPSPTAYPTIPPTPTIAATVEYPLQDIDNALATSEAELSYPIQFEIPSQIEFLGNAFGMIQYVATHGDNLFGPFAPIFQFILFLTPIALILFIAYAGNLLATTIYSIVSDVYQKIRG
jgi:hypothetical protein